MKQTRCEVEATRCKVNDTSLKEACKKQTLALIPRHMIYDTNSMDNIGHPNNVISM